MNNLDLIINHPERIMPYYDSCFDFIADPVQRNSTRQQWRQMVEGGLSIGDLRVLLDKYSDFRLAIEKFVSVKVSKLKLNSPNELTVIADTLPEFKTLIYTELVSVLTSPDKLTAIANTLPELKPLVDTRLEYLVRMEQEDEQRRIKRNEDRERSYPIIKQYISKKIDEIFGEIDRLAKCPGYSNCHDDRLEDLLYDSYKNFPSYGYIDSHTKKGFYIGDQDKKYFYEKLKREFKNRKDFHSDGRYYPNLPSSIYSKGVDVVEQIFFLSSEIIKKAERREEEARIHQNLMEQMNLGGNQDLYCW